MNFVSYYNGFINIIVNKCLTIIMLIKIIFTNIKNFVTAVNSFWTVLDCRKWHCNALYILKVGESMIAKNKNQILRMS